MSEIILSNLLQSDAVKVLNESNKSEILQELANSLASSLQDQSKSSLILKALEKREAIGSTGFGNGISIPHCKLEELTEFAIAVILVKDGVAFDAIDKQPVHIFVAIAGPEERRNDHLHLLSKLSRILNDSEVRDELLATTTPKSLEEALLKHSPDALATESEESILLQLTIQIENLFEPLVEVITGINDSSIAIINAEDSSQIMGTVPLFKGFFADDKSFNKIIQAVIPKKFANECVRQIEHITGSLKEQTGILLTMQELTFCSGALNY